MSFKTKVASWNLLAVLLPACGGSQPASQPVNPPGPLERFEPAGCPFAVAPRPEYTDASAGKSDVGPTPNIRRVRLGLGGNVAIDAEGRADPSTSAGFAWQTDDGTLASEVQWGTTPDASSWPAENRAGGMTWLTPPGAINDRGPARMHEAYVCGLTPNTVYYYRVGGGPPGQEVWSDVYSFKTAPAGGDAAVRMFVTGDSRTQENDAWRLLQRRLMSGAFDLQVFSGDVANLAVDQAEWEQWLDGAWKDTDGSLLTLGQVLTLPAHGNHENHSTLFFGNVTMPQDLERYPDYGELFFSFDVGPVHLVIIDDAWIVSPSSEPEFEPVFTEWLRADLAAANMNRGEVPWIITVHHHSPYSSSNHGDEEDVLRGRAYFGPIYDEYHVDLVLAGHDHNYERSKPVTTSPDGTPTVQASFADGTVYVVCAGSGAPPYSAGMNEFTEISRDWTDGSGVGVYGTLAATKTELSFESTMLTLDGTTPVIDTFTITK